LGGIPRRIARADKRNSLSDRWPRPRRTRTSFDRRYGRSQWGQRLAESAALLCHADLFVGTDSGPLNLAAATGTEAFGLFGATPVLRYSKFIHAIVPEGGRTQKGMQHILPAQALEDIKPYLSRRKEQT
jgi:hypothetical protein